MPKASITLSDALRGEYENLFNACNITNPAAAAAAAAKVKAGQDRYAMLETVTNVPWFVIGCIHFMESDCDFNTHLYNGDPLSARTVNFPPDHPIEGDPPFTFEFSGLHALIDDGFTAWTDWGSVAGVLFMWEKFNGFGYRERGVNTPYLWGASDRYTGGLFVRDHVFDPAAVSRRCGCATIWKHLRANNMT